MRKVITLQLVFLLCTVGMTMAQKKNTPPDTKTTQETKPEPEKQEEKKPVTKEQLFGEHFATKRALALRWNDAAAAKDALLDLIVEFPGDDSLVFSLAYYYYENRNPTSSVLVCQDLLARNPKNLQALELVAIGYEELGINDRALQSYESLYLLTSNVGTLYKMAFLQFNLKKFPEAITNIDIVLAKPEAATMKVSYNDKDGKPKEYALKVALLNLKGMVYKEQGDKVNAKKFFDACLAEAQDFVLAKKNLEELKPPVPKK